jgi:hypothetical protein
MERLDQDADFVRFFWNKGAIVLQTLLRNPCSHPLAMEHINDLTEK